MKSSLWCPSAIFVAPTPVASRYSTPRRNRAHSEHGVSRGSSRSSIDGADGGALDVVLPAARGAGLVDEVVPEVLVAGVDGDRDEAERDRRALPQHVENLHQRPAVLAARQADHDAVAVLDEAGAR